MKLKAGGRLSAGVKFGGVIAAIVEQINAGERGAEQHAEVAPGAGFVQRGAHAADRMAEVAYDRQPAKQFAQAQIQLRMEVANNGAFGVIGMDVEGAGRSCSHAGFSAGSRSASNSGRATRVETQLNNT